MRTIAFLFTILFWHCSFTDTIAQPVNDKIIITGYIPDSLVHDVQGQASIHFYNSYNNELYHRVDEIFPITIEDSRFRVEVNPKYEVAYFSFEGLDVRSIFRNVCMIQAGDSVCLNIRNNKQSFFTGRGASKLNYQLWLGKQWSLNFRTFYDINDPEIITHRQQVASRVLEAAMDSLSEYKAVWDPDIYNLLRISTVSRVNNYYMGRISNYMQANNSTYLQLLKAEINRMYSQQSLSALTNPFIIDHAFLYTLYLYNLNIKHAQIISGQKWPPFELVYNNIKKHYSGPLRDKLIGTCFLDLVKRKENSISFLPEALNLVNDEETKAILLEIAKAKTPEVPAYDFNLKGINGEQIKLEDFRGKVVILDTWFNGCPGCIGLKKQLDPIVERYKNNENVVFVGINVDKDKQKFVDGVNSGLYTTKHTVSAYTNGLGTYHPMLLHYQYRGYPNLLLIDKKGLVISANPPRPADEERRNRLIELIEEHL